MTDNRFRQGLRLDGWAIAVGMGAVAAAVAYLVAGINGNGSVFIGVVLCVVVGLILGMPRGGDDAAVPRGVAAPRPGLAPQPGPARAAPGTAAMAPPAAAQPAAVQPAVAPVPPAAPRMAAAPVSPAPAAAGAPARPAALAGPRGGLPDDLKRIRGVGPKLEAMCHRLGFYHFDQIAAWTPAEVAWVDDHLEGFRGRVTRDDWVAQAQVLAAGGDTDFSRRVDDGAVY
jgi:predicted flap endonuclease-1-like 5' DNA nuclease